jgi:hypothetical protein
MSPGPWVRLKPISVWMQTERVRAGPTGLLTHHAASLQLSYCCKELCYIIWCRQHRTNMSAQVQHWSLGLIDSHTLCIGENYAWSVSHKPAGWSGYISETPWFEVQMQVIWVGTEMEKWMFLRCSIWLVKRCEIVSAENVLLKRYRYIYKIHKEKKYTFFCSAASNE